MLYMLSKPRQQSITAHFQVDEVRQVQVPLGGIERPAAGGGIRPRRCVLVDVLLRRWLLLLLPAEGARRHQLQRLPGRRGRCGGACTCAPQRDRAMAS